MTDVNITEQSKALFVAYFNDAPNWSGCPLVGGNVGGTPADKGNLTQLKRVGLVTTWTDEGNAWLKFTTEGLQYAESLGLVKDF